MFLERMKTTDFKPGEKYSFVIPTGSTEQHGPFLPLGTDSFIQDRIIQDTEKALPEIIFLPTLRITCSEEHEGFPGTIWISTKTMKQVLKETCESLKPYAKQIIFVTAHGGNVPALNEFVDENKDCRLSYIEMESEEVNQKTELLIGGPVEDHAGNTEISMMLDVDESITTVPGPSHPKTVIEQPFKTNRLADFSKDGIADNHPKWVIDKEHGKKIFEWMASELTQKLKDLSL